MNLLNQVLIKFSRKKPVRKPLLNPQQAKELKAAMIERKVPQPKGRVIKQTRAPEFNPDVKRGGGRIVKAMPRQLQKIKQAQEKFEDDTEFSWYTKVRV